MRGIRDCLAEDWISPVLCRQMVLFPRPGERREQASSLVSLGCRGAPRQLRSPWLASNAAPRHAQPWQTPARPFVAPLSVAESPARPPTRVRRRRPGFLDEIPSENAEIQFKSGSKMQKISILGPRGKMSYHGPKNIVLDLGHLFGTRPT